jgi:alpha-glucosidase
MNTFNDFQPFGKYIKWSYEDTFCMILMENACMRIGILNTGACQVYISKPNEDFDKISYATEQLDFISIDHLISETNENLTISSPTYVVNFNKKIGSLSFNNLDGKSILSDEDGLGHMWAGSGFLCHKKLRPDERFIGLGEKTGPVDKRGRFYTNSNTDHFGFNGESDPLYASIPFYMGITESIRYGIFLDNSYESRFDFGTSQDRYSSFGAIGGPFRYYVFVGEQIASITKQYSQLTGLAPLPPKWALGYQQCRYSYYPDTDVVRLMEQFDQHKIPIDMVYLDIHYMDQYKVFTWHPEYFPNPQELIEQADQLEIKLAVILDPGIKKETGYVPYEEGNELDIWVNYIDGQPYEGHVWPGPCRFPDFTNPTCRQWWAEKIADLYRQGIRGFWNDMNEPAVWGKQFPNITQFNLDGQGTSFLEARNVYGMQMSRATHEGAHSESDGKRIFTLSRAGFAGSQRYTALWTGDNSSNEEHLKLSAIMVANLGLAGFPLSGADVGGFIGECTPELYMRWIALASFQPLFRGHTMIDSKSAEPWSFGENATEIAKSFIQFRYRLLPYWYSLFYEYTQNALPPCRSLVFEYADDPEIYNTPFENQFCLGNSLIISPGNIHQQYSDIYLPSKSGWYDIYSGQYYTGGQQIIHKEHQYRLPIFIKEGAILLLWPENIQRANHSMDSIEIHLFSLNIDSCFTWYDDDGHSNQHLAGQYMIRIIEFNTKQKKLTINKSEGTYENTVQHIHLYIHGEPNDIQIKDGANLTKMEKTKYTFLNSPTSHDPFHKTQDIPDILFGTSYAVFKLDSHMKEIQFVSP